MAHLTATANDTLGLVHLDADFSVELADAVGISRERTDTGAGADVRVMSVATSATRVYDQLNANPDFETNTTGWTALGGATIARSTVRSTRGVASLLLTTVGTTNGPGVESEKCPVVPGQEYAVSASIWSNSSIVGLNLGINWYNASNTLIGTTVTTASTATTIGVWTLRQVSGLIAPAGSVTGTVVAQYQPLNHPTAGTQFWLDEVRLLHLESTEGIAAQVAVGGITTMYDTEMPLDVPLQYTARGYVLNGTWGILVGTATAGPVQVNTAGFAWLKDPTAPANSQRISITQRVLLACIAGTGRAIGYAGIGTETRPANAAQLNVNNRENPIVTARRRGSVSANLLLVPHTFADRDDLRTLLTAGTPLLFQAPGQYGVPDRYMAFGDEAVDMLGQKQPFQPRVFTLPFTVTDEPPGPAQGPPGARYRDLCQTYATWDRFVAGTDGAADAFGRTVANGLGSADAGGAYTLINGPAAFNVTPGAATVTVSALGTAYKATLPVSLAATELSATVQVPVLATGDWYEFVFLARYQDDSNYLALSWRFNPGGTMNAAVSTVVGGTGTEIANNVAPATYAANSVVRLAATLTPGASTSIAFKGWLDKTREPTTAATTVTTAALPNAGRAGFEILASGANTNAVPYVVKILHFRAAGSRTWLDVAGGGA